MCHVERCLCSHCGQQLSMKNCQAGRLLCIFLFFSNDHINLPHSHVVAMCTHCTTLMTILIYQLRRLCLSINLLSLNVSQVDLDSIPLQEVSTCHIEPRPSTFVSTTRKTRSLMIICSALEQEKEFNEFHQVECLWNKYVQYHTCRQMFHVI